MALVNQVAKKLVMSRWDIIKFQLLTYCHLNGINLSSADLDCLTSLGVGSKVELTEFCNRVAEVDGIFKSSQSARNAISKAEKKGLILKEGKNKKKIFLNPEINIQTSGNILLDYKFAYIESEKA
jgi:hypothetical protein